MSKNSKNLLILGNGFDLAFGYRTSYSDFATLGFPMWCSELLGKDFWPFNGTPQNTFDQDSLFTHFKRYKESQQNEDGTLGWIDLEMELLNYAKSKQDRALPQELINYDTECYKWLRDNLWHFIKRMVPNERKKDFEIQPAVLRLFEAIRLNGRFKKIYTFNYTDPLPTLQRFCSFTNEQLPSVTYVHGQIDGNKSCGDNIILGINEDREVPKEYRFLYKIRQDVSGNITAELLQSNIIVIYGLSMGVIDREYFEPFFEETIQLANRNNKPTMIIATKSKDSRAAILDNILEMGYRLKDLSEFINVKFAVMDDLKKSPNNPEFEKILAILAPSANPYIATAEMPRPFDF